MNPFTSGLLFTADFLLPYTFIIYDRISGESRCEKKSQDQQFYETINPVESSTKARDLVKSQPILKVD